ncbi:MAG: ECF transporter S component [Firmicutes bacterium]|nr:ECF transporter S component [Bacillota bacterium]
MKPRELAVGALLTALALVIPLAFRGWLQVYFPVLGFSATLASHVPSMLAMFIGPLVAAMVGIGSTIGFAVTLPPVIAARAASHIVFAAAGAYLYRRGMSPAMVMAAVLPIHAILEGLAAWIFVQQWQAAAIVAGGTALHHVVDAIITLSVWAALARSGMDLGGRRPLRFR